MTGLIDKVKSIQLSDKQFTILSVATIVAFAIVPLFVTFPFRVNIFLSWDGAYRMSLGHIPYKDMGLPMGFGYWIIPAVFFKIFGPYMVTLIKAQVFINVICGLSFLSILKSFKVSSGLRWVAVFIFCLSYSFSNFWPWYNHSVIVYELIGMSFLLKYLLREGSLKKTISHVALATFFLFLSFFTKQDGGGLALLIALALVSYHAIVSHQFKIALFFIGFYSLWVVVFFIPFVPYDIGYWFNIGQAPHNSRISLFDFIDVIFAQSMWEKFYIICTITVFLSKFDNLKTFFNDKISFTFFLFTLGILTEALLFQVTSYTPPNNNIFFHSFGIVYLASQFKFNLKLREIPYLVPSVLLVLLWWSGTYWKYINNIVKRAFPESGQVDYDKISRNSFMIQEKGESVKRTEWIFSNLASFKNIYMPKSTVDGMNRLMNMDIVKSPNPKILNMTELTPLAHEIGYELEKGKPLWYHKGVGIFQPQVDEYVKEIQNEKYDLVLFETIPTLNNFYPYEVQNALKESYQLVDKFLAPRSPTNADIEVYIKKKD